MSDDPVALAAYIQHDRRDFDGGVIVTSGIKASDHKIAKAKYDFEYYCYVIVDFELDAAGRAQPNAKSRLGLFKEKQTPL